MTETTFDDTVVTPERIGQIALVGHAAVFASMGHLLFADVPFGGIVGLMVGLGTLLHLPYVMWRSGADEGSAAGPGVDARRGTAGVALDGAGIVAFGARFVLEAAHASLLVGVLAGLVAYVPLHAVLVRTTPKGP
jgi:hypothetical protein